MTLFVLCLVFVPVVFSGTCTYIEYPNGYQESRCLTNSAEYQAPCADAGVSGYCHGLQLDPCTSSATNGVTQNCGNEPDGVTRTCEHHETGLSHVVCCRDAPGCTNSAVQCTALKNPDGPLERDNCITPGPMKQKTNSGDEYLDDLERDWRVFHAHPIVNKERPQNDTTASWAYAWETCSNLDDGDKGWRLCQENEIYSGACCKESSGVQMCEFHDADVWLDEYSFCDSVTTCEVVERFQKIKGTNRGAGISNDFIESFCVSEEDTQFTSSRFHLCESKVIDGKQRCIPKDGTTHMGDNSGNYGYFIIIPSVDVPTFPHNIIEEEIIQSSGVSFLFVNITREEAAVFAECDESIDKYTQCAIENMAFTVDPELGDYESCSSVPVDEDTPESRSRLAVPRLWGSSLISASEAVPTALSPFTYAYVIDTGVHGTHTTFKDRNTGLSRVLQGYDTWDGTGKEIGVQDLNQGHGTHVAGTLSGSAYHNSFPNGVSQFTSIIPINIFNKDGGADLQRFYKALKWIASDMNTRDPNGRFVINLSICKPDSNLREDVVELIDTIINQKAVIIAAACNSGEPVDRNMFGNYPGVVVVGSSPADKSKLSTFSGWDLNVDVHVRGETIYSASNSDDNKFVQKTGTSMATPYISGVFAKLWEIHPEKTSTQLIQYFKDFCLDTVSVSSPPNHLWCKEGNNECPDEITQKHVNIENELCITGVLVDCPYVVCNKTILSTLYGVDITKIDFVGKIGTGIKPAGEGTEKDKYRITGERVTTSSGDWNYDSLADNGVVLMGGYEPPVGDTTVTTKSDIGLIVGVVSGVLVLFGLCVFGVLKYS